MSFPWGRPLFIEKKTWQAKSRDLLCKYTRLPHTPFTKTFYFKKGLEGIFQGVRSRGGGDMRFYAGRASPSPAELVCHLFTNLTSVIFQGLGGP